jgi:ribosome biogenesis GTPase / thiamine phosphate phosphatase
VKSTGLWYNVQDESGKIFKCRIKGKFKLNGLRVTNPVAVGDDVDFYIENDLEDSGMIKNILNRRNYVVRESPRRANHLHLLAANIDQTLLFSTIREPNLKQGFIDRFLLMTEPFDIPTIIIFNKADLYEENDMSVFEYLKEVYESIGYTVILTSAVNGQGLEELKSALKDKITLVSGHSGVGKSTLINSLQPQLEIRTNEISSFSGKGQHTTTFAEMHPLDFSGYIIDTPGIKSLSFINMEPGEVYHNFREIFAESSKCKYANCLHLNEPKCAVKEAVEAGSISELRYMNYMTILEEVKEQKHWERNMEL